MLVSSSCRNKFIRMLNLTSLQCLSPLSLTLIRGRKTFTGLYPKKRYKNILSCSYYTQSSLHTIDTQLNLSFQKEGTRDPLDFGRSRQESEITQAILTGGPLTKETVEDLKNRVMSIGKGITPTNVDSTFLELCCRCEAFDVGKSYFYLLHFENKANLATIGKFFKLCYTFRESCNDADKQIIKEIYKKILDKYETLDGRSCENAALGLAITDLWKQGLDLLKMASETCTPGIAMYSAIIEASFLNGEPKVGWDLMEEVAMYGDRNLSTMYKLWLNMNRKNEEAFEKLLLFFEKYNIHPTEEVANLIATCYSEIKDDKNLSHFTKISSRGICKNCTRSLHSIRIETEEFQRLRDAFIQQVLIGKDIYLKSKPEEFESYSRFLENTGKVDVVLDGLNIAYAAGTKKTSPQVFSKMLSDVVHHFVQTSKRVMVVGRKHMMTWPKVQMNYIKRNSYTFFIDNVSVDDPLVLYAAMHSGLGTIFVSRDMMRGHRFLLKDPLLRKIFSKWQQSYQYHLRHIEPNGTVHFQEPLAYLQDVQRSSDGTWHLPVNIQTAPGISPHLKAKSQTWLCLS